MIEHRTKNTDNPPPFNSPLAKGGYRGVKGGMGGFKDKNVLVVGLARSGAGAANLLSLFGADVWATDIKPRELLKDSIKKLSPSVKVILGSHPEEIFNTADLIVVSPGVPLNIPLLMSAKQRGIPIIGELELAYQVIQDTGYKIQDEKNHSSCIVHRESFSSRPAFIGITGTNGKSTVTTLIDLMLKKANFKTLLGGNIGNALTEEIYKIVTSKNQKIDLSLVTGHRSLDYVVAEVSSFQLESIQDFKPFIGAMLNITPDHLDRYADMQEYIDAKARIFENQSSSDYLILNADDPIIKKVESEKLKVKSEKPNAFYFSMKREVEGIYYRDGRLCYLPLSTPKTAPFPLFREGAVSSPFELIAVDEIKLKGVHNIENAMVASLVAFICGCSVDAIRDVLKDFPGLEHRLEFVCEIDGVSFINDSKGTNIGAVVKSLEGLENVVLIMGGRDKNGDFSVLRGLVKENVKALILLGEAKNKIADAIGDVTKTVFVNDMKEAVETSMEKASDGDVVLLSPGCASFDMFTNFEDRGRKFKQAVREVQSLKFKVQS